MIFLLFLRTPVILKVPFNCSLTYLERERGSFSAYVIHYVVSEWSLVQLRKLALHFYTICVGWEKMLALVRWSYYAQRYDSTKAFRFALFDGWPSSFTNSGTLLLTWHGVNYEVWLKRPPGGSPMTQSRNFFCVFPHSRNQWKIGIFTQKHWNWAKNMLFTKSRMFLNDFTKSRTFFDVFTHHARKSIHAITQK